MRILDRYLLRGLIASLCYCMAIFLLVFVIVDVFNNLDEFLKHGVSLRIVILYYLYMVPVLGIQVLPVATLVAVLYALGNLNRHHEIIALKASGVSAFQILAPYLFTGIVLSFGVLWFSETYVPKLSVNATAIMEGLIEKGKKNLDERSIQKVALYGKDNRMIFAREFEMQTNTLHDVVLFEDNPHQVLQTKLTAKKARYQNGGWTFYDTMRYQTNRRGTLVGEPSFAKELPVDLEEKPDSFVQGTSQVEFMNTKQLREHIEQLQGVSRKLAQRLLVDLHYKVAFPFVSLIVMLIGAPLAMRSGRGSTIRGVGVSLGVVVVYYGLVSICLALGKGGYLPPIFAAWFSNFFFAAIGVYFIRNTS